MTKRSARFSAYIFLLANTLVWGVALPFIKLAFNQGLDPNVFLLGRYSLALLFSLPIIITLFLRQPQLKKQLTFKNLRQIIPLELLGTFLTLFLLYQGLNRTTAVESSLIAITWPLFVTLGGVLFLKEKEQKNELLGLIITIAGTILLVVKPLLTAKINGSLTGNLLILAQNFCIATYYLLVKKHYRGLNKWLTTHISYWVGFLGFLALNLITSASLQPVNDLLTILSSLSWSSFAIVYMALFGSIIGLTFYLLGQDRIEASEASIFTYLQPIFAIPLSFFLLHETVSWIEFAAIFIIIIGVYIAQKR